MMALANGWRLVAFVLPVVAVIAVPGAVEAQVKSVPPSSQNKNGGAALSRAETLAKQREARAAHQLRNQLERAKVLPSGRREDDDYFVVGQGEMLLGSQTPAVDFVVIQGKGPALTRTLEFLQSTPSQSIREYWICGRFKSEEAAEQSVAGFRQQYLAFQSGQQELKRHLAMQATQNYQAPMRTPIGAPSPGRC